MRRFIVLLLLPLLYGGAAPAPTIGFLETVYKGWDEGSGLVGKLARANASMITVTNSHQPDAASCGAKSGKYMQRALYSCTPLLEIFRAREKLSFAIGIRGYLPDPESAVSEAFKADAREFFALAQNRRYPAADVALVQVHINQAMIYQWRKSYKAAALELECAIRIIETSEIENPEFDIRDILQTQTNLLEQQI